MKKRVSAVLLCVIMVMALLPATAFAVTPNATSVFIAGAELTSENPYYHNGVDEANTDATNYNAYFNAAEGTLTLKGLEVSDSTATKDIPLGTITYAIYADGDLTICVDGDNSVSVDSITNASVVVNSLALYVTGEMTVQPGGTGRGSLTAESKGATIISDSETFAMCNGVISNELFVESGATLIGKFSGESAASNVFNAGVNTDAVTVNGGTLKGIADGEVTCGTGDTSITCGIMVYTGDLSLSAGSVEATGGQSSSEKCQSFGVAMKRLDNSPINSIIINGGSFTATSGNVHRNATTVAVQNPLSLGSGITAKGSTSIDGSNPVTYVVDDNANYKWVSAGTPTVTSVLVNPATVSIQKGGNQTFNATVVGEYNPAQTVTWTVEGGAVGTSISSSGVLTIAANETAAKLTVKATSTVNTAKFGTATVTVTTPTDPDPIEHKIIKGQNGEWTEGSTSGLSFTADGDYDAFTGVSVDGITLSSDEYTSQSGSTIVTLKAAYLETLSVGQHALRINFTDGYAETHFTINASMDPDNPATGDISQPLLWLGIALLACTGLVASLVLARRKRQND